MRARGLLAFLRARRADSAVEFGLIAPLLMSMFVGVSELGRYIYLWMKVTNVASNVADLVARSDVARGSDIDSLIGALPVMLSPFESAGRFGVVVTGVVQATAADPAEIVWQRTGGSLAVTSAVGAIGDEAVTPPDMIVAGGDALIVAEVFYDYRAWLFGFVPAQTVVEVAYARPRRATLTALE
jgi:hypothetical protein